MLRAITWTITNLPILVSLVTAAIAVVEALGQFLREGGEQKKARAIAILKENLSQHLALPDFVQRHLEAILGVLIDVVVLLLNLTRGKDWGEQVEVAAAAAAPEAVLAAAAQAVAQPRPNEIDARLDELQTKLSRD